MSTTTVPTPAETTGATGATAATDTAVAASSPGRAARPVPFSRLLGVELRKTFDTRAGFWLMASIGIVAVLASTAVVLWAPDEAITLETFSTAIGMPMSVILPVIAILSVTSEYTQRTALTTYTLVPHRGRVLLAKLGVTVLVGVAAMLVALAVGSLGNLVGAAVTGVDPVWDLSAAVFGQVVLANVLGMLMGFMLGVVLRSSPAAIVGYFVYSLVLPGALGALAAFQQWFADLRPWVDVNFTVVRLYDTAMTAEAWAQLGVTTLVWLWLPLVLGSRALLRAEVK
jgi:hypothetical protein